MSKPGYATTEFWLSLVANLLGAAFASGLISDGTVLARIAGLAAMVLAGLGYTVSRTMVKKSDSQPRDPQAGISPIGFMAGLALASVLGVAGYLTLTGCSKQQRTAALAGVIDCGKADKGALLGLAVEIGASLLREASTDQDVLWKAIGLKAAGKGATIGGCVLARLVKESEQTKPGVAEQALMATAHPGRTELERLRADWGGVRWSVED